MIGLLLNTCPMTVTVLIDRKQEGRAADLREQLPLCNVIGSLSMHVTIRTRNIIDLS